MGAFPTSLGEVYILDFDANHWGRLLEVHELDRQRFRRTFDGSSLAGSWKPMEVYWDTDRGTRERCDFSTLIGVPVFSERAVEALGDLLEGRGELLALEVAEGDRQFLFNVTRLSDALDEQRSEIDYFDDGTVLAIDHYEFAPERLAGETIFKLAADPLGYEYVTDGFRDRVQEALTGFVFDRRVWVAGGGREAGGEPGGGGGALASGPGGRAATAVEPSVCPGPDELDREGLCGELTGFLEDGLGVVESTHVELVPGDPAVDVLIVAPGPGRAFRTLVTCGMAVRAMDPPEGLGACRFAELVLCLPEGWPLEDPDGAGLWALSMLRRLARVPHETGAWLWADHTVPNGDPPRPWGPGTELCGALVRAPSLVFDGFARFEAQAGAAVQLLGVVGLDARELDFAADRGGAALSERLREAGVTELLDPARASVAPTAWEPGREEPEVYRIVPAHEAEDPDLELVQALMARFEIGPDDAEVGVWLAPSRGQALYTPRYYRALLERLGGAETYEQATAALEAIRDDLHAATFPY